MLTHAIMVISAVAFRPCELVGKSDLLYEPRQKCWLAGLEPPVYPDKSMLNTDVYDSWS